jgi:hypothetical protein
VALECGTSGEWSTLILGRRPQIPVALVER